MLGFGKATCVVCGGEASGRETLRGRHRKDVRVCATCYEQWDRSGRSCAGCQLAVKGTQEAGVFPERHAFGHADCGAIWLPRLV